MLKSLSLIAVYGSVAGGESKDPKFSELCPGQELQPHNGTLCWKFLFVWKQIVTLHELGLLESGLACYFVESLDVVQRRWVTTEANQVSWYRNQLNCLNYRKRVRKRMYSNS